MVPNDGPGWLELSCDRCTNQSGKVGVDFGFGGITLGLEDTVELVDLGNAGTVGEFCLVGETPLAFAASNCR